MSQKPYEIDQMISAKQIAARVEELAEEISRDFAATDKLVVVGLLRGSFIFIADLVREIDLPVEVDFLEASSYGNSTKSSREVRVLKDLTGKIAGRDVLVVSSIPALPCTMCYRCCCHAIPPGWKCARCSTSRRAARWIFPRGIPGSRYRTNSSWATALIMRSATATCPISARSGLPDMPNHAPVNMKQGAFTIGSNCNNKQGATR